MEKDEILNCIKANLNRLSKEELEEIVDKIEVAHNEIIEERSKIYEVPFTGYFKIVGRFLVKADSPNKAKEILENFGPTEFSYNDWWDIDREVLLDREIGEPVVYDDQNDSPEYDMNDYDPEFKDLYFQRKLR